MKSFISAVAALAFVLPTLAAPFPAKLAVKRSTTGAAKPDSYIILLKDDVNKESHLTALGEATNALDDESYSEIVYDAEYSAVLNGYAAVLKGAALDHVLSDPNVALVEEDAIVSIDYDVEAREPSPEEIEAQLQRVREVQGRATNGQGVIVYGIDTGILTTHTTFGGRASWGATFGGYANADGNGHGTHTAGTAVGTTYGVATSATVVAVKVLSDAGSGSISDVIAGVNWAVSAGLASGKPAIATMSLGGSASTSLDTAVSSGISQGIHFTIAAGNSNVDASSTSPARVSTANTVGASDSSNVKASFSNYGSIVDVFAPGVSITSAWYTSNTATYVASGTSMATPFVAGVLAVAISEYGNSTPATLTASLKSHARAIVTGVPSGTTNLLATLW